MAAVPGRITVFNLDTLEPIGEIPGTGGNGVAVDPKSGHGFSSSKPVSMFDTKTLKLIKQIDVGAAQPDGILFDAFNDRVYIFSHPTKDATVIDSKDGTVLGTIDLGGVPEQAVADDEGDRALPLWGQGQVQRAGAGREESCALRGMRELGKSAGAAAATDDGDSECR